MHLLTFCLIKKKLRRFLGPLGVVCSLLSAGCVHRVHDYVFSVTGYVTAEDGSPLHDVDVVLNVENPVYSGLDAVKTQRILSHNGGFIFMYLAGNPHTNYIVIVSKDGFEAQTISGKSPPAENYKIQLKRSSQGASGRPGPVIAFSE
jgi:hypothetical protein